MTTPLNIKPSGQQASGQHQIILGENLQSVDHSDRVLVKLQITSRPQLCFREAEKWDEATPWLAWGPAAVLSDPYSSTDHDPDPICSFRCISLLKDRPGKLMRFSPETSLKIPAFRKPIKTLMTKDAAGTLSLEQAHSLCFQVCNFVFFLLSSEGPHKTWNQKGSGQGQLVSG